MRTVVDSFKGLTGSVGNRSWIREWEKLEEKAADQRGEAMMIYNVSPIQGMFHPAVQTSPLPTLHSTATSQAGKKQELLAKTPSREASEQVHWVWTGMLIELEQWVTIVSHPCWIAQDFTGIP